jgi:hypothetical protein
MYNVHYLGDPNLYYYQALGHTVLLCKIYHISYPLVDCSKNTSTMDVFLDINIHHLYLVLYALLIWAVVD